MGTSAFFELNAENNDDDDDTVLSKRPTESVDYVCKTGRKLTLKRVFLNEKKKKKEGKGE